MKYKLKLSCNDKEYKAEADELEEALLAIKPPFYKSNGTLEIKAGDKSMKRTYGIVFMKRMFSDRIYNRIVAAKKLKSFLK